MNAHKGDTPLEINGKTYTLRYNHMALERLESACGKSLMSIMQEMSTPEQMKIGSIINLFWTGLQRHHPDMTREMAADLLDDVGGISAIMPSIDEAFGRAFNASGAGTKGTNPPQKEVNGIGTRSLSSSLPTDMIPHSSGN
jgi:hypothetical protein